MKIHILDLASSHPLLPSPPDWYPVYINRKFFKDIGISFSFFNIISDHFLDCDIAFVSSRFFDIQTKDKTGKQNIFSTLSRIKRSVGRIYWFDFRNSTGNTQFEVMPYVDKYLKSQLLKDRSLYQQKLYGNRLYTDYIHRRFNVCDSYDEDVEMLLPKHENKLSISWNPIMTDYRGGTNSTLVYHLATDRLESYTHTRHHISWYDPNEPRINNLLALFNIKYARRTVVWQRKRVVKIIDRIPDIGSVIYNQSLSLRKLIAARRNSKIILSLFGWGEICSREVQAWIAGAAVIMPDLSHLETWPVAHIAGKTYQPIKWDLSDLPQAYDSLISDNKYRLSLAIAGQNTYKAIWSEQGRQRFVKRLHSIIHDQPAPLSIHY